jgi:hypothetical protein
VSIRARVLGGAVASTALAAAWARSARGDDAALPRLHLVYEVAAEARECPDEATFRRDVAVRLGYDPFVAAGEDAPRALQVAIAGARGRRSARLTLSEEGTGGRVLGRRTLGSTRSGCDDLVADAAFAASVAIDPVHATSPAAPSGPAPAPERPAPPSPSIPPRSAPPAPPPSTALAPTPSRSPSPPAPASPPGAPLAILLRAGGAASVLVLPGASPEVALSASLRRRALFGGVELRYDAPASDQRATASGRTATVRADLLAAGVHLCVAFGDSWLAPYACAALDAGALRGRSEGVASPASDVSPYAAVAPRAGVLVRVAERVAFDARADVPFVLTATELRVDGRAAWTTPPVGVILGVGASVAFTP